MAEQDPTVLEIHGRLLSGDPLAPSEAAERLLPLVTRWLRAKHLRQRDLHLVETASIDALLDYLQHPGRFDPQRGTLSGYLRMAADRDLRNALRGQTRRGAHETTVEDDAAMTVAVMRSPGNAPVELHPDVDTEPAERLEEAALALARTDEERAVLSLLFDEVRATGPYVKALGLSHLSIEEQRREVKRVKDRIAKRLRRSNWGQHQ